MIRNTLFALLTYLVFFGWGAIARRLFQRLDPEPVTIPTSILGFSIVLLLASLANATATVGWIFWVTVYGIGMLGVFVGLRQITNARHWAERYAVSLAAILLCAAVVLTFYGKRPFNAHDDYYAYLDMPLRILATGQFVPDPFNYRSVIAGPGGMSILQVPFVAVGGLGAIRMLDLGAGFLLTVEAIHYFLGRLGAGRSFKILTALAFFVLVRHDIVNVTSYFTSLAVLICLLGLLIQPVAGLTYTLSITLLVCSIGALKNTGVPFALALCALLMPRHPLSANSAEFLRRLAVCGASGLLMMGIWYAPRIGISLHSIKLAWGPGPEQAHWSYIGWFLATGTFWEYGYLLVFLGATLLACGYTAQPILNKPVLKVGAAVIGSFFLVTYITGGAAISRYSMPCFLIGYLFMGATWAMAAKGKVPMPAIVLVYCAGFYAFGDRAQLGLFSTHIANWSAYTASVFEDDREIDATTRAQLTVPVGAKILVHTAKPFLMDFSRNPVAVVDFPGASSPTQEMPLEGESSEFKRFLIQAGIKYVWYSYGDEANFTKAEIQRRLADPRFTPWQRALNRRVLLFHDQLMRLRQSCPISFDDGNIVVMQLPGKFAR